VPFTDVLTERDLLGDLPEMTILNQAGVDLDRLAEEIGVIDWGTKSIIAETEEVVPEQSVPRALYDDDLGLAMGDEGDTTLDLERFRDRGANSEWGEDDGFDRPAGKVLEDDLGLNIGGDDTTIIRPALDDGGDMDMPDFGVPVENGTRRRGMRESLSPLSDLRPSEERDLEATIGDSVFAPQGEEESMHPAQRVKRRRVIQMDSTLELGNSQIRDQQEDRSRTMRPSNWIPRDPVLLALLSMQRSGGFVSSVLGDGRTVGWAPELRDVLSVAIVRKSGELKRKRDSGVADVFADRSGRFDVGDDTSLLPEAGHYDDTPFIVEDIPAGGGAMRGTEEPEDERVVPVTPPPDFDETAMPLLHPADAGPVSRGTTHAVHMLRDHFAATGAAEDASPAARARASVLFQELLPEARTSRADATKMFFEVLVLATKDAVKVEQKGEGRIGAPIRLRAKRGLWGAWAEQSAGGNLEGDEEEVEAGAEE
jgi:cohesin complex subunit SCC1